VVLVKKPNEQHQKELGEPTFAPTASRSTTRATSRPGPIFQYAQDSNTDLFDIERYDLETGEITTAASGAGGSVRPPPRRRQEAAFIRRERTKPKLYVKDLATGVEKKVYDDLDVDMQEGWAVIGLYPNMAWTPDSKSVSSGPAARSGASTPMGRTPLSSLFHVADTRGVLEAPHPKIAVSRRQVHTKMTRFAAVSPDASRWSSKASASSG
jgi:hypothetical protein